MKITVDKVKAGRKTILTDFCLNIKDGSICAVLGKNGSGKSTLIFSSTGHPSYSFTGDTDMTPPVFVGFQKPVEMPELNTRTFLMYLDNAYGYKSKDTKEFLSNYKEEVALLQITENMLDQPLNINVSGGENKRLELLQMAIIKPKTVLLDEIDTGLDLDMIVTIGDFLKMYYKKYTPTILIVTHNLTFLKQFPLDNILILNDGSLAKEGGIELISRLEQVGFTNLLKE